MALGYGTGIKETPFQCMKMLKERLPKIEEDCRKLRNKLINNQFGDCSLFTNNLYLICIGLVETYQKIIEYYDYDTSGLTIHEVD
jgi:hypothetical protein